MVSKKERDDAKLEVKMWLSNDWELKEETPEYFLLAKERTANGWLVFLGLCLYIIPGVAYYIWVKTSPSKKKIIK